MLNLIFHCVCVLVALLCLIFCDPVDSNPPDSSVLGILQARILEWVAIPFSKDLPNPGIEPRSPTLQADSSWSEPPGIIEETQIPPEEVKYY